MDRQGQRQHTKHNKRPSEARPAWATTVRADAPPAAPVLVLRYAQPHSSPPLWRPCVPCFDVSLAAHAKSFAQLPASTRSIECVSFYF